MANINVTRYELVIDGQNARTGLFETHYNLSTIEMLMIKKGEAANNSEIGRYVKYDFTGFTAETIKEGDLIKDYRDNFFLLTTVNPIDVGDYYYGAISELQKAPTVTIEPSTNPNPAFDDAKYRTKVWLDAYLDNANLTQDDDGTPVYFITTYANPKLDVLRVFFDPKNVDLMYSINDPVSVPHFNADKTIGNYEEQVPINMYCVDKDGITAANLKWKAECEVRRLCEEKPFGSIRLMDTRREVTKYFGPITIYGLQLILTYRRGPG